MPDRASVFSLFWRMARMDVIVLGSFALLMLIFALGNAWQAVPMARDGLVVEGRVVNETRERRRCTSDGCGVVQQGDSFDRVTRSYVFTTLAGERIEASRSFNAAIGDRPTEIGRTVAIRYLPDDPRTFELGAEGTSGTNMRAYAGIAALVVAGTAGLLGWRFRQAQRAIAARDGGEMRRVRVRAAPAGARGPAARAVHWMLNDGTAGHSLPLPDGVARPRPGSSITVFVDGTRSWWEGDTGPRA